jgi:hypothetical protein
VNKKTQLPGVFVEPLNVVNFLSGFRKTVILCRGELLTHPELPDWLAVDFMEHDWNVKRLVKQILMLPLLPAKGLERKSEKGSRNIYCPMRACA